MGKQKSKVHPFDVFKHLSSSNGEIKVIAMDNLVGVQRTKKGANVVLKVDPHTAQQLLTEPMAGALILVPTSAYNAARAILEQKMEGQ
jgi:hypothetical protein